MPAGHFGVLEHKLAAVRVAIGGRPRTARLLRCSTASCERSSCLADDQGDPDVKVRAAGAIK